MVSNHAGFRRLRRVWLSARFRRGLVAALAMGLTLVSVRSLTARPDYSRQRAKLAQLSPGERDRLMRNYERFLALDPSEQRRLEELDRALQVDPQGARLRSVMHEYFDWLKRLPAGQRAELHKLAATERLDKIAKLRSEQQTRETAQADRLAVMRWLEGRLLAALPDDQRKEIEQLPPLDRRLRAMRQLGQDGWARIEALSKDDIDELKAQVSPEFKKQLDAAQSSREVARVLRGKFFDSSRDMFGGSSSMFQGEESAPDQQALEEFFARELTAEQRDWLLSLPPEEMRQRLRWEYWRSKLPERRPDRSQFGQFRGRGSSRRTPDHGADSPRGRKAQKSD
jgi:hypothetical protein